MGRWGGFKPTCTVSGQTPHLSAFGSVHTFLTRVHTPFWRLDLRVGSLNPEIREGDPGLVGLDSNLGESPLHSRHAPSPQPRTCF